MWGLAISPDGRTLVSAGLDGRAIVWDLAGDRRLDRRFIAGRPFEPKDDDSYPVAPVFAPGGRALALTQSDGSLDFLDTNTLRSVRRVRVMEGFAAAAVYSPDGGKLAIAGEGGQLRLLDAGTLRPLAPDLIGLRATSQAVAFSPDGRLLAAGQNETGSMPGDVRVWDVGGRPRLLPVRFRAPAGSLAFSNDGRELAAATLEKGTTIRDVPSGRLVRRLRHADFARTVAYSPDGKLLAVGLYDGKTELWRTRDWKRVGRSLTLHTGRVLSIGFSPNGRTLVTSSADGTVALWDVATQKPLGTRLTVDPDEFVAAAFDADGSHVFAVSQDGKGVRWDVRAASWSRRACLIAGRELTRAEWRDGTPRAVLRAGLQRSLRPESPTSEARTSKRRGRDSNPRRTRALAGFQDRCIRPLCHPSGAAYRRRLIVWLRVPRCVGKAAARQSELEGRDPAKLAAGRVPGSTPGTARSAQPRRSSSAAPPAGPPVIEPRTSPTFE